MKKFFVLVILTALVITGCGIKTTNETTEEPINEEITPAPAVLTQEREDAITSYMAPYEDMFSIYEIEESNGVIVVWLNVGENPVTENAVKGITDGVAKEIAGLFNFEIPIKVTGVQILGDEKTEFGSSLFSPENGEVEYTN